MFCFCLSGISDDVLRLNRDKIQTSQFLLVVTETGFAGASVVVSALASCCDEGKLADILHYVVQQVFLGRLSKVINGVYIRILNVHTLPLYK